MADGQSASGRKKDSGEESVNSGARIQSNYLVRKQEVVSVNRTDLEDIRDFDSTSQGFTGFGIFLLGGAGWLGAEKVMEALGSEAGFSMTPLLWVCLLCVAVGGFLWYQGWRMAEKKVSRIERIFDETKEAPTGNRAIEPPRSEAENKAGRVR